MSTAKDMVKGTRVRWQSPPHYDDEALLVELRLKHPKLSWAELTNIFNKHVPSERQRTPDAISNKGPLLMKAYNDVQTTAQSSSYIYVENNAEWNKVRSRQYLIKVT